MNFLLGYTSIQSFLMKVANFFRKKKANRVKGEVEGEADEEDMATGDIVIKCEPGWEDEERDDNNSDIDLDEEQYSISNVDVEIKQEESEVPCETQSPQERRTQVCH